MHKTTKSDVGAITKRPSGITLIALVITIVVLIILAGVAINLTLGENGIFNKAKQAREDYKIATNEEQEGLANVEVTIDEITGGNDVKVEITASNYGQYVNYPIDIDGNTSDYDWQIFYKEEDTSSPNYGATYIIADYYVPVSKMTTSISSSKAGMTLYTDSSTGTDSTYSVYWASAPTYQPISDTVKQVFMYDYTGTSNDNVKAVSRLLNLDNWKDDFVTSQLQAKGGLAIGGPTLNMWCASWNKAYQTVQVTPSIPNGGRGYQVNGSASVSLNSYTGYTSAPNVYFPTKRRDSDGTNGYRLASPSSGGSASLMGVDYSGGVYSYTYNNYRLGVRPLVYLPSSITLETSGTPNVWNINYGD